MKLSEGGSEYVVITPESPLGLALPGKLCGDEIHIGSGKARKTYTIVAAA